MSNSTRSLDVVQEYYGAFAGKDFQRLRKILSPGFQFRGPLLNASGPDEFIRAMSQMPFEATVSGSRFIADGNRVAHAFLWSMTAPAKADIPMCEVLEVDKGRIQSADLYYDARLFPQGKKGGPE